MPARPIPRPVDCAQDVNGHSPSLAVQFNRATFRDRGKHSHRRSYGFHPRPTCHITGRRRGIRPLPGSRPLESPLARGSGSGHPCGNVTDAESLVGAARDVEAAYDLVHAMAGGEGFAERERIGPLNFARLARREGVKRFIYLGGLGDESKSKHLRSRHETARILAAEGLPRPTFGRRWSSAPAAILSDPALPGGPTPGDDRPQLAT